MYIHTPQPLQSNNNNNSKPRNMHIPPSAASSWCHYCVLVCGDRDKSTLMHNNQTFDDFGRYKQHPPTNRYYKYINIIYIYPLGERWPQQTDAAAPDARVGEVLPEPVRRVLAAALARRHPLLPGVRHPGRHLRGAA